MDTNNTPHGKSQNRRVEFVRKYARGAAEKDNSSCC
jgi:hypothetical protein